MRPAAIAWALAAALLSAVPSFGDEPLVLEAKIPLGDVAGRIDHMAIDLARQRLFVAELGNDSVGVVDLKARKTIQTLSGLDEPQGLGYVAATDTLYVANGGDGKVRLFRGADLVPAGALDLGSDADDVRVDDQAGLVLVGHGDGAIALIDATNGETRADIPLDAHPEGFALAGGRIFVNLPDAHEIAVLDRDAARLVTRWKLRGQGANFPMAIDGDGARIITVFRRPPMLAALSATDGRTLTSIRTCGDADDVFIDARRRRLYVSCGAGMVDVLERRGDGFARLASVLTSAGARTSLFVPELDRLFVAARAVGGGLTRREPAAIWVFRPTP
jgi:hypothetical protein